MIIYLTPQGKAFNPNRGITIGDTQYPPKWFLDAGNQKRAGVTTKEVVKPDYDPETQTLTQDDTGEYVVSEISIVEAKERKRNAINAERQRLLAGGISYDGNTFDSDDKTIQRITAIFTFALADPQFTSQFITKDNKTVTLSNADCRGLGQAAAKHEQTAVFTARQLKDQALAAKATEELRAIKWPE